MFFLFVIAIVAAVFFGALWYTGNLSGFKAAVGSAVAIATTAVVQSFDAIKALIGGIGG